MNESFVNCTMRTCGQQRWADGRKSISRSEASEKAKELLRTIGEDDAEYGEKSGKIGGTDRCFQAGMTAVEVSLFGGWRSPWTPLHYKHNSVFFKRDMSNKFHGTGGRVEEKEQGYGEVPAVAEEVEVQEDENEDSVLVQQGTSKRRKM